MCHILMSTTECDRCSSLLMLLLLMLLLQDVVARRCCTAFERLQTKLLLLHVVDCWTQGLLLDTHCIGISA